MAINSIPAIRVAAPAKRPVAQAAAAPAPLTDAKAQGPVKSVGKVGGAVAGAAGGFSVSAALALFGGLAKWGMDAAPRWFGVVAWVAIGAGTVLGAYGGSKLLGGLGEKIENWYNKL